MVVGIGTEIYDVVAFVDNFICVSEYVFDYLKKKLLNTLALVFLKPSTLNAWRQKKLY